MKKCLVFLVLISICLTGCIGNRYKFLHSESSSNPVTKTTLRFISPWSGKSIKADTLKLLLDNFMAENPDIEIINESMSNEDFLIKLKTDFVSGNEPDIFTLWPGYNMNSLIMTNKVADLTALLNEDEEWKKSFDKSALQYVTIDDKIFGLPLEVIFECLFINRDMFSAYQVKIPTNFEELKQTVVDFRQKGVIPIAYNVQNEGSLLYKSIIANLGGRTQVQKVFVDGNINQCYIDASKYLKELYDLSAFPDNLFELDSKSTNDLFLQKQAAMIVQSSEFIGNVNQQLTTVEKKLPVDYDTQDYMMNVTVDMIPFPIISGANADPTAIIYGLGSGTFFMSSASWADTAKKEASVKLLKFLTSNQSAKLFAEQTGMLVSIKNTNSNAYYSGLMRRGVDLIDTTKELITPPNYLIDQIVWENIVIKQLPYVLDGVQSSQDMWKQVVQYEK